MKCATHRVGLALAVHVIACVLAGETSFAKAQSFDCREAEKPDELVICQQRDIAALDLQLTGLYSTLLRWLPSSEAKKFRQEQRSWLVSRHRCGDDAQCVRVHYESRILALRNMASAGIATPPPAEEDAPANTAPSGIGLEDLEDLEKLE